MNGLKHLLAATDLPVSSQSAIDTAVRLAAQCNARLTIMHVVNQSGLRHLKPLLGGKSTTVIQRMMDSLRDDLQQLANDSAESAGVSPTLHLSQGKVMPSITSHADAIDADLLVLGARGGNPLRHLALGSTAERLLRLSRRPTLVVKRPSQAYRRVLIPVDFSAWSEFSFQMAQTIAPQAELVLMHVVDVPFEGLLTIAGIEQNRIEEYRIEACRKALLQLHQLTHNTTDSAAKLSHQVVAGDAVVNILQMAQGCDLIVIGKHGRQMMKELLIGSVTRQILSESGCDVLVISR